MKNCLRPPISDHVITRPLCHHQLIPQKKIISFGLKVSMIYYLAIACAMDMYPSTSLFAVLTNSNNCSRFPSDALK